jgi:hypothetical protein
MAKTVSKAAVRKAAESKLEKAVASWVVRRMDDYDGSAAGVFRDLFYGGCESGIVGDLVYYSDSVPFYEKHREDIWALALEQADDMGAGNVFAHLAGLNHHEPNTYDQIANFLAWYGFEEAARRLAGRLGLDD